MGVEVGEEVEVDELVVGSRPGDDLHDVGVASGVLQRSGHPLQGVRPVHPDVLILSNKKSQ
jgi:hypothetical protein